MRSASSPLFLRAVGPALEIAVLAQAPDPIATVIRLDGTFAAGPVR